MRSRDEIREALTGPIASIRPPFLRDGGIDYDGLRNTIDFNVAAGSKTMLVTAGDSHLLIMSRDEIAEVTRVVTEHTAGRAMVVAADCAYDTRSAVEHALHVREIGADVLMIMPPDWARSCTPETLAAHYAAIARHIPVMIVTNVYMAHGVDFGLKTLEIVLDKAPNVVSVKDDFCGEFGRRMTMLVHERMAVFAGGQKSNHMDMMPYGAHGYLSTFITFKPEIAHRYWGAIEALDLAAATAVIRDYDAPFFQYIGGLTGGFDAGMHGVIELFGIAERWRRPPYYSLSDQEMEGLAEMLRAMGIRGSP